MGKIYVIGLGPGNEKVMVDAAKFALRKSDVIVGYVTYINLIKYLITDKEIVQNGMHKEIDRCEEAIAIAKKDKVVSVVSSGDSGVYGMAGLILELVNKYELNEQLEVEVVPGITAVNSCASLLGAPLMHDYTVISLSDWLTPLDLIYKRIILACEGDFVISLYNPKSKKRPDIIKKVCKILLERKSKETPVGVVVNAYRENQKIQLTTLDKLLDCEINMLSTVIIGNSKTFIANGKMITPRGYNL